MSQAAVVGLLAVVATALLVGWEWRRVDATRRGFRVGAIGLAGVALALLGLPSLAPDAPPISGTGPVTLVTDGVGTLPPGDGWEVDLGTASSGDETRPPVPDAAFVLRRRPRTSVFHVAGSGVTAADAHALRGQVVARKGTLAAPVVPLIDVLTAPREVLLGETVRVQGRVTGLASGAALSVALEAPDGTVRTVEVAGGANGSGTFSIDGGIPVATGTFEWRLRLGSRGETVTVGVSVVQPDLPRVLFWESAPSTETARLRRWLGEIGATSAARVQVSADRVRTTGQGSGELRQLSTELLKEFDLLICDTGSFARLTAPELAALRSAVDEGAMGLLVVTDGTPMTEHAELPLPWSIVKDSSGAEGAAEAARRTRLQLFDGTALDEPVAAANATIVEKSAGRKLAIDPLDRAVAISFAHGRGQVAVSLVQDSWRWLQQGQAQAFARFWTALLSASARPVSAAMPWQVLDTGTPFFVDQPVRFAYVGSGDPPELAPVLFTLGEPAPITLAYQENRVAVAWPREAGWHHISADADGLRRSLYVQPPQALPALREERRRRITDRLVVDSPLAAMPDARSAQPGMGLRVFAILVLLGALTGLWIEERWRRRG